MKNVFRLMIIAALATTFALPAFAQDAAAGAATASPQDAEAKAAKYKEFLDNYKGNAGQLKVAYAAAKEYVSKYGGDTEPANAQIVQFIQKWIPKYEKVMRNFEFDEAIAKKDLATAAQLSRQILADDPENVHVYMSLTGVGYMKSAESNNKSMSADTVNAARKALELLERGKVPEKWTSFPNRDEAIGGLNFTLGYFLYDTSPEEGVKHLIKVAQSNSNVKNEPTTYIYLGEAYNKGEFAKLAAEYKLKYDGQPETPEGVALYERVMRALDRVIDAYARAAALTKDPAKKKSIMDLLASFYKGRHETADANALNQYVAGVLSRPLPLPGDPVTPTTSTGTTTPATTTTPAAGGTTGGGMGTNGNTTQPATNGGTPKPASTTGTTPKPVSAPATTTPKPISKTKTPAKARRAARGVSGQ